MPQAIVEHGHSLSLSRFWSQHFNYGRGACQLRRSAEKSRRTGKIGLAHPGFYFDLVCYPLTSGVTRYPYATAGLLLLAQAATAAGFVRERCVPEGRSSSARPDQPNVISVDHEGGQ